MGSQICQPRNSKNIKIGRDRQHTLHIMEDGSNSPRRGTTRINRSTLTNLKNETLLGQENFGLKLSCLSIIPYYICKLEKLKKKKKFLREEEKNQFGICKGVAPWMCFLGRGWQAQWVNTVTRGIKPSPNHMGKKAHIRIRG